MLALTEPAGALASRRGVSSPACPDDSPGPSAFCPKLTNGDSRQDAIGARRSISSRRWESMSIENIIIIVVIVLIVLFVLGYFGRGRFRR